MEKTRIMTGNRRLKKAVGEMRKGERLYVNAISLTTDEIGQLRKYIKEKVLMPDESEARKKYEDIQAVMSGETILPQMTYIRR